MKEYRDDYDDVDHYFCGDCKHYHNCKRIDHDVIKFAIPWFKCYDREQHRGIICCEFEPATWCVHACKVWEGFDNYWKAYVQQWLPYQNVNTTQVFVLYGDTNARYHVPLLDYVYGTMFEGNRLKAVKKEYLKRDKKSDVGYQLVTEKIEGVELKSA